MECCAKYKIFLEWELLTFRHSVSFHSKVGFMVWSAEYYLTNLLTKLNFLFPLFYILISGILSYKFSGGVTTSIRHQQKVSISRDIYESSRDNIVERIQWPPAPTMNGNLHPEAAELEKKFSADEHGESEEKTETCKVKNQ